MTKILAILRLDMKLLLREKLALYIMLVPVIMSALILFVLTVVEHNDIHLAVTAATPQSMVARLEMYADVEIVTDFQALQKRVNEYDSMAGIYWDGNLVQVLFQGNEGREYETAILAVTDHALNTNLPEFVTMNVSTGRDALTQMIIAVLLSSPVAIGGIVSGFNIVTEKETLISRAYRISPLPANHFLMARYIVSVLVGIVNLVCITFILGAGAKMHHILLAAVFALPLFAASPMLIGGIAKDKMGCISMIKVIMLVFICLPIAAVMTPQRWQFFYWPFPVYWHYKTMESILAGDFQLLYGVLTFIASGAVFALLSVTIGEKLQKA